MSTYDRLIEHLPTLWQPQPGDDSLLAHLLASVGGVLDDAGADIGHVLRAHWFDTADAAAWAVHFAAHRRERGLGALRPRIVADRKEALAYPYVRDLARLAELLDLPPWRDPASLRETVEGFRLRIADVIDAYREGLVTPGGLRRLIDAALPEDLSQPAQAQRSRYSLEEPAALRQGVRALVATPVVQEDTRVAPLSRWSLAAPGTPAFVIEGVAADAIGGVTAAPMVERYTPGQSVTGIGVAWTGTLAPGQALRLAPDRRAFLLGGAELLASDADANPARDPSANGPFSVAATLAAGRATELAGATDGSLWLIQRTQATQRVQRWNGSTLQAVDTDAPAGPFNAIAIAGSHAWLGTDAGLFHCALWSADGVRRWSAVAGIGAAVRQLVARDGGGVLAASAQGLWQLDAGLAITDHRHATLDLRAVLPDGAREWLATDSALFVAQGAQRWRYAATGPSEDRPDWALSADGDAEPSPLPAFDAIAKTPDGSLWLGGAQGLARWFADADGTTRLAAFPDLFGAVHHLRVDDRGRLWIAAEAGLFTFDGRDLAQYDLANTRWLPLGDADTIFPDPLTGLPRGFWQYDRTLAQWQRFDAVQRRFADPALPARAAGADAIADVALRPALRAHLGSFNGSNFVADAAVPAGELRLRIKPDEQRIVDGVLPYLPQDVPGAAWRYLQLASAPTPPANLAALDRPWWSIEGQLFLPPDRLAGIPGHLRDAPMFLTDAQHEGQFGHASFAYPPSARLWALHALAPTIGIRVRLALPDPGQPIDPALAERVWQLIHRARPAGVPLQLMAEGSILKET